MRLYHYRSIPSAVAEIQNGTFRFAAREELNDPLEGYLRVYWQGDRAAWEGLFRNYISSLSYAVELYLLRADEDMLRHRSLIVDLHRFDDVPLGQKLRLLGDAFLREEPVKQIAAFYGEKRLRVRKEELVLLLRFLHGRAMRLCLEDEKRYCGLEAESADRLLRFFQNGNMHVPLEEMRRAAMDEEKRTELARTAENLVEDAVEFQMMRFGEENDSFLYGAPLTRDRAAESRQRRNWLSVAADFPKLYGEELMEMVYPAGYVVCFSAKGDNSAMWGNYAGNHRGAVLIYETGPEGELRLRAEDHTVSIRAKPVIYDDAPRERNFFETLGRLTRRQIRAWLTGADGISACLSAFSPEEEWRRRYWEVYEEKTFRKMTAWRTEEEYRLALSDNLYRYEDPTTRFLRYEPDALKGVIFGLYTSEADKKQILDALRAGPGVGRDFRFYQAEYDGGEQKITVREKAFWSLENRKDGKMPEKSTPDERPGEQPGA